MAAVARHGQTDAEGGYRAERARGSHGLPTRLGVDVEERIISTVHALLR